MESHECCARCRTKSIVHKSDDPREHCQSEDASENRTTFSRKHTPGCPKFHKISEEEAERKNGDVYIFSFLLFLLGDHRRKSEVDQNAEDLFESVTIFRTITIKYN